MTTAEKAANWWYNKISICATMGTEALREENSVEISAFIFTALIPKSVIKKNFNPEALIKFRDLLKDILTVQLQYHDHACLSTGKSFIGTPCLFGILNTLSDVCSVPEDLFPCDILMKITNDSVTVSYFGQKEEEV